MRIRLLSLLLIVIILQQCVFVTGISAAKTSGIAYTKGEFPFVDMPESHWGYLSAEFCYINGIIQGQGNSYTFAPDAPVTRAAFAVMLARALNADITVYKNTSTFSDCKSDSWYSASVEWTADMGYLYGIGNGKFSPDVSMTREQIAVTAARVIAKQGCELEINEDILSGYTDSLHVSDWAKEGVEAMLSMNIMGSTSVNELKFSPEMTTTRAQAAKIFMCIVKDYMYADCSHELTKANCLEGQKCMLCGLVFTLPGAHYGKTLSCKDGGICDICGEELEADTAFHKYSELTCTEDEICLVCGDVRTKAEGHKFVEASCIIPKYCSVCKQTEGSALGHDYSAQNCVEPGKCIRCSATVPALGHTEENGQCLRCASEYERIIDYLNNLNEHKEIMLEHSYDNGDSDRLVIGLTKDLTPRLLIEYIYEWSGGGCVELVIMPDSRSFSLFYEISYTDTEGRYNISYGDIYPNSMICYVIDRDGDGEHQQWLDDSTVYFVENVLSFVDIELKSHCRLGIYIFGFKL